MTQAIRLRAVIAPSSAVGYIFVLRPRQKHKETLLRAGRWGTEAGSG